MPIKKVATRADGHEQNIEAGFALPLGVLRFDEDPRPVIEDMIGVADVLLPAVQKFVAAVVRMDRRVQRAVQESGVPECAGVSDEVYELAYDALGYRALLDRLDRLTELTVFTVDRVGEPGQPVQ